jgi:hypothetical protein
MSRLSNPWFILGLLYLSAPILAADDPSPDNRLMGANRNWEINEYIKGTPEHIRGVLNGEVERLIVKIRDNRSEIKQADKDAANDIKVAQDQLHQSAIYKQTVAEQKQAEADLAAARAGGSADARVAASGRFNKARFAIEKMEKDAILNCKPLLDDQRRSYELSHDIKRLQEALDKASKWRDHLLDAMRNGFAMKMHVGVGSVGTLPKVIVEDVVDSDHVLVSFEAWMIKGPGKEEEGVTKYYGDKENVKILIGGVDTKGLKKGDKANFDHVFVIEKKTGNEINPVVYVAARKPNDADTLFDAIVNLRESLPPAKGDKTE